MADTKTVAPKESPGTRLWNWLTETQVWTSVFRHGRPDSDRNRRDRRHLDLLDPGQLAGRGRRQGMHRENRLEIIEGRRGRRARAHR